MRKSYTLLFAGLLWAAPSSPVLSQPIVVTNAVPGQLYLMLGGATSLPGITTFGCITGVFCNYAAGINVNDIATTSQVSGMVAKAYDLSAVSAAMKDAIPNTGDRFAIRLNAAGFEGHAAGAVGVSWNVTDSARLHLNYGQGRSQGIVSGGLNLSFR